MASKHIIEALPEENLIFPDDPAGELPDGLFPDFCCLDCQHRVSALRQLGSDDPCIFCSQGREQPNQELRNTGA